MALKSRKHTVSPEAIASDASRSTTREEAARHGDLIRDGHDDKLKGGQSARYYCDDCMTEFEVTLEPKAKGDAHAEKSITPKSVDICPFCASGVVSPC